MPLESERDICFVGEIDMLSLFAALTPNPRNNATFGFGVYSEVVVFTADHPRPISPFETGKVRKTPEFNAEIVRDGSRTPG